MSDKRAKHTFELFAPNNREANLLADFNDWEPIPLEKSDDGYFRHTAELPDGVHHYRFEIRTKSWFFEEDEWKTITDPYAVEVEGETQNAVLRLRDGRPVVDEYEWRHDETPLPDNVEIVIYEMHVGDFSGGEDDPETRGRYTDVVDKLDYLTELGVNTIELMPVKESPGDFSWGYSPLHYFAVEENYGASFELKELIDECHGRGIRVIIDGVYNHANSEMSLTRIDHDYWFHHEPKDPEHNWGPEFNYGFYDEKLDVMPARKFILDTIRFWLGEYHIDGVRYDGVRQIGDREVLGLFTETAHRLADFKPFINIAEHIPVDPSVVKPEGPMDSCWNDAFMYGVVEHLTGETFDLERLKDSLAPPRLGLERTVSAVNYLCNHDHNRLLERLAANEIFGEEAFRRAGLGAVLLMTAVGIPMIWMGEEFGEYKEKSQESNKIDWSLLGNEENAALREHYRTLIELRKTSPALRTENIDFIHEDADKRVLAYWRHDEEGGGVAVILNLSEEELPDYTVGGLPAREGGWRDLLAGHEAEVRDGSYTATLRPFTAVVLVAG